MNIVFGNQKGGVGKTTHAILLSNFLVLEKQLDLLILDLDFQGSIKMKWEQDLEIFDNPPLYEVMQLDLEEISSIFAKIINIEGCVIFDLPGKIDDNNLISVYQNADLVICPFSYDKLTFESTIVFAQAIKHVNMEVPIVFLPNRLKRTVTYALKEKVNEALSKYGNVAPEIADRISLQRLDCFSFSSESKSILNDSYNWIYHSFLNNPELFNPK